MTAHFADDLTAAIIDKHAPVCVGIDPSYDRLPEAIKQECAGDKIAAMRKFCTEVIQTVAPIVPAIKPQIAYFEVHQAAGVELYFDMIALARQAGLMIIGDIKRSDIGSTAQAYAQGHVSGANCPDAVTVNGYLGSDGLEPFIAEGNAGGRGIFILVRTSNPSGAVIQDFADASGKKLYEHMAEQVAALGQDTVGSSGYSRVGAVVGATYPAEARELRVMMPEQLFLVPGYGAQGATADDCAASFKSDGTGAIVNASRSIIYAYDKNPSVDWRVAIAEAAKAFAADVASAVF
ncbi:MAG: orotidine-5'-phosphate decarboxylase [Phycisphaerales bacterium]|jgi:orotidine-5'-phosphate decarboxylase|nr:orotidine-5'-phosphate decarboxylase [Phycisphaerales bacterium]